MPFRPIGPRNHQSKIDNVIGVAKVPVIKKRYPRNTQSNRDARAAEPFATTVDSRFDTVTSVGWGDA